MQDSGVTNTTLLTPAIQANITAKVNNFYGADFKPGILLSPQVAIYALAGFVMAITGTATFVISNTNTIAGNAVNLRDTAGYNVGVGVEYLVIPHLSVNAEWSYIKFSLSHTEEAEAEPDSVLFTIDNSIDVTSNRFLMGVNYLF